MTQLHLDPVPNPTGKGAPSFRVDALAFDPLNDRVAGVTADFGCFFDRESGAQSARWKEPSSADRALFRSDGQLVIVAASLALVSPEGARSPLSKSLFPGEDPVFSAVAVDDVAIISAITGARGRTTMRGVDLRTGEARWTQKTFVDSLTTHARAVYGVAASSVVKVDLDTGALAPIVDVHRALACVHVDAEGLWVGEADAPIVHRFDHDGTPRATLKLASLDALRAIARVRDELVVSGATLHDVLDGYPQDPPFELSDLLAVDLDLRATTTLGYRDTCARLDWKHSAILAVLSTGDALWVGTDRGLLRAR